MVRAEDQALQQQLQETIDLLPTMYETKNPALIDRFIDAERPHMRRVARQRYDTQQQKLATVPRGVVDGIERQTATFVLAHVQYASADSANWWLFRQQDGVWKLSEPAPTEQTPVLTKTTEHTVMQFDAASTRFADAWPRLAETAIADVSRVIPIQDIGVITITVQSSSQILSTVHSHTLGVYQYNPNGGQIYLLSPFTVIAGAFPDDDWQTVYTFLLKHEYVHYLSQVKFGLSPPRTPLWMLEGLAEYVSDPDFITPMVELKRTNGVIPILPEAATSGVTVATWSWQDDPLTAYAISKAATRYCIETYGGMDAYVRFMQAYQERQNYTQALDMIYHVSPAQFNQQWLRWVDATYS